MGTEDGAVEGDVSGVEDVEELVEHQCEQASNDQHTRCLDVP